MNEPQKSDNANGAQIIAGCLVAVIFIGIIALGGIGGLSNFIKSSSIMTIVGFLVVGTILFIVYTQQDK